MGKLVALLLGLILVHLPCSAQLFGTIDAVSGNVTVVAVDGSSAPATLGQKIYKGQSIVTQSDAEAHAITEDGGMIAVRPNSTLQVLQYRAEAGADGLLDLSLIRGALRSITGWIGKRNPAGYRVVTPTATIGIRGTDHETTVIERDVGRDRSGTFDSVFEGATVLRTERGEININAGQHGFVPKEGAQVPQLLDQPPEFASNRALRLEERIKEKKEVLIQRVQQWIEEHPRRAAEVMDRLDNATDEQRDAAKRALRRKLQQRRAN
jgi:hypothetical protein